MCLQSNVCKSLTEAQLFYIHDTFYSRGVLAIRKTFSLLYSGLNFSFISLVYDGHKLLVIWKRFYGLFSSSKYHVTGDVLQQTILAIVCCVACADIRDYTDLIINKITLNG